MNNINDENEYSCFNLSRSKSYDDFSTMFDVENEEPIVNARKSFSRQGAFRKRTPDHVMVIQKRSSLIEFNEQLQSDLNLHVKTFEYVSESEKFCQKKAKTSFSSFTIVKDMWKSLKKDNRAPEKEEIKKKTTDWKNHSSFNGGISEESDSSDLNAFFRKYGEKVSKSMDSPLISPEDSWTNLILDSKTLNKVESEYQAAVWEIIETEASFIKQLGIIIHVFNPLLTLLLTCYQVELTGVDPTDVFGNISDLYEGHMTLWNQYISSPLSITKEKGSLFDVTLMKNGFCKLSNILNSYISFMSSLPAIREKISKFQREYRIFRQYIEWTKQYCRTCREGHLCILTLPFQRITRYKILLERVKSLASIDQKEDISEMIDNVHSFLQRLNSSMVGKYSMKEIKEKIVNESSLTRAYLGDITKNFCEEDFNFDIMRPLAGFSERILIHEGRMKLRECNFKTKDVHCFLCNDLMLVCVPFKNKWDKMKMHKSPIRLDKMWIKDESEGSFTVAIYNDFKVIDNVMVLVGDSDEVKLWVEKCQKAKATFVTQFSVLNTATLLTPGGCVCDVPLTSTRDDAYLVGEEYQRVWTYSETTSSIDSTDSAFSQPSSHTTQVDSSNPVSRSSSAKCFQSHKCPCIEDESTIDLAADSVEKLFI